MISPISNQNQILSLQSTPRSSRMNGATSTSTSSKVDSPAVENSETAASESRELPAQKNAEAMRSLSRMESTQLQSASPRNIVSSPAVLRAYQNSAAAGQRVWTGGS